MLGMQRTKLNEREGGGAEGEKKRESEREASYVNAVEVCFVSSLKLLLDFGNIQPYVHKYIRRHTQSLIRLHTVYLFNNCEHI